MAGVIDEEMQSLKKNDKEEPIAKSNCEEVTEQFSVCNNVNYVRDVKGVESLKGDTKMIDEFIDSGKSNLGAGATSK